MKNNFIKSLIYTIIFIGSISLATFPTSYTKYNEKELEVLKYSSELISLNKSEETSKELVTFNNDVTTATVKLNIPKNNAEYLENVTKNIYSLNIPNGCTTTIDTFEINDENSKEISLICDLNNSNIVKNETDGTKTLNFNVQIDEQINEDIIPFRYKEFTINQEIPEKEITKEVNEEENFLDINKLKQFQSKITEIIIAKDKYKNYSSEVTSYINSANLENNQFELRGIEVKYQEATDEFFYQIDENFLGYARTYASNQDSSENNTMIFSTEDKESLENVFEFYLNEYYSKDLNSVYLILNYIKSNQGISSLILEDKNINGITKKSSTEIEINEEIMTYLKDLNTKNTSYIYNGTNNQIEKIFIALIDTNENIPNSLKEEIKQNQELKNLIYKEYNQNDSTTNYIFIKNEVTSILIEIINTQEYKKLNYTNLNILETEDLISIELKFIKDNMPAKENYQEIIKVFEKEFNAIYDKDSLQESNELTDFILKFNLTINKNENIEVNDQITEDNQNTTYNKNTALEQIPKEENNNNNSNELSKQQTENNPNDQSIKNELKN